MRLPGWQCTVWERLVFIREGKSQNAATLWHTGVCGHGPERKNSRKTAFDHRIDHIQKKRRKNNRV